MSSANLAFVIRAPSSSSLPYPSGPWNELRPRISFPSMALRFGGLSSKAENFRLSCEQRRGILRVVECRSIRRGSFAVPRRPVRVLSSAGPQTAAGKEELEGEHPSHENQGDGKKHHHHHHHHHHKSHQSNKAKDVPDLMQWMIENRLPPCKVMLKDRPAATSHHEGIHYVAASEDLQPGDIALRIPSHLVVTLERVLGDETVAELLTTGKLSELACLALYLMYEKKQGRESFWFPFIKELDRQRARGQLAVESPLLWTEEELQEYLQGSPMQAVVRERLAGIKREYQELDTVWFMAGSLFKQYPYDIPSEAFSFEIFKQAFVAVQACVVHLQGVSLARRFALVPLGPPLLSYRSNCRAMLKVSPDDNSVILEVDRFTKAGEPIVVWCGPQPNTRLLLNYGIVDEDNPHDRLIVEAALDMEDPLYQQKRAIVQKHDRYRIQSFQLYKGREKDAVAEMLPYLRLGHVSDPRDLDAVIFTQGPSCGVSACNECAVLEQLESYFHNRLHKYRTTIAEDDSVIAQEKSNLKKLVATRLLRIEKEILGNTLAAVREMLADIPSNVVVDPCIGSYMPILK